MNFGPLAGLLLLTLLAAPALGQSEGEVGVPNVPPSFGGFDIQQTNGHYSVRVSAIDFNGWADISKVTVEILDVVGAQTGVFQFRQFNATMGRIDEFRDLSDSLLVRSDCRVQRNAEGTGDIIAVRCTLNLTFIFVPAEGERIRINITDIFNISAIGIVPYTWMIGRLPAPLRSPVATLSISGVIAVAITAVILRGRISSDRLAVAIERRKRNKQESLDDIIQKIAEERK